MHRSKTLAEQGSPEMIDAIPARGGSFTRSSRDRQVKKQRSETSIAVEEVRERGKAEILDAQASWAQVRGQSCVVFATNKCGFERPITCRDIPLD